MRQTLVSQPPLRSRRIGPSRLQKVARAQKRRFSPFWVGSILSKHAIGKLGFDDVKGRRKLLALAFSSKLLRPDPLLSVFQSSHCGLGFGGDEIWVGRSPPSSFSGVERGGAADSSCGAWSVRGSKEEAAEVS
ncbi:hypothetical protein Taro_005346 [Colocasia esculenta]|uniref:Uncharacterized protein n=1 Tax=Colocasia esculenta TaxID=4460 RepID=A0A843TXK5_COLES|nr:hypothetical protein [Colocasia esculenta]